MAQVSDTTMLPIAAALLGQYRKHLYCNACNPSVKKPVCLLPPSAIYLNQIL